jgi:lipooligosaccharide transport system permease protein
MSSLTARYVEREARVFARLWRGSVFSSFIAPALMLGALGLGLGGLIDDRNSGVDGLKYIQFVAPGLLAATVMNVCVNECMWPVMGGHKWTRQYHAMVSAPLTPVAVFQGVVAWASIRAAMSAAAFLVVAALLGGIKSPWAVLALPAAVLTGAAFAAVTAAFSISQNDDLKFPLIQRLAVQPLFLLSGTFFPVKQLPDRIEWLAWFSPLWHGVELCRDACRGEFHAGRAVIHVAVLLGCTLLGARWGRATFTRRLAS